MTENKRIVLNVLATYGRTLLSVAFGIFSGRWILEALGDVDFGLIGVVGGMTAFITFLNAMLSASISRFYAYSIGRAKVADNKEQGLEDCRRWFNTAVLIHTVGPLIMLAIGYPIGEWAIRAFLNIPSDKVGACLWVWRFTCIACFVGMVNVPFSAMYGAKQYIAEMTVYGVIRTTCNFIFIYYMVSHPDKWMVKYMAWTCGLGIAVNFLICVRASFAFPECRLRMAYLWSPQCLRQLGAFSMWQSLSSVGMLLRGQGVAIVMNKFFGAALNASSSLASSVEGQMGALSGAMRGAFQPAITQACGAGDMMRARKLANTTSKFCVIFTLVFALPFFLEGRTIIDLWLVQPPEFIFEFCVLYLLSDILDRSSLGQVLIINANGDVAQSQLFETIGLLLCFPMALCLCLMGVGAWSIGLSYIASFGLMMMGRLYCARKKTAMSVRYWMLNFMVPVVIVSLISLGAGAFAQSFFIGKAQRFLFGCGIVDVVFVLMTVFFVLDADEKRFLRARVVSCFNSARQIMG